MKNVLVLLIVFCSISVYGQDRLDDIGRITIHAYVPERENLPVESQKLLETKLSQIITTHGIADNEVGVRFVLTAKIDVVSKDIVAGPPQRISQKLEITLMLGDVVADKIYSQMTIASAGIGQSLEKSYISAFKNINPKNTAISAFIQEGKEKVLKYYQTHCEDVIAEARKQVSLQNYEDAIMMLTSIPDVCTDCFNEAAMITASCYQDMLDARGAECLNEAQAIWANNPNREGAQEAVRVLSLINFAASCQPKVASLMKEITAKMNEIDRREWEHQMQVYQNQIEREKRQWAQSVREYEDRVKTQRMYLKACRDVAISYAKNQPKTITRVVNYNRVILW